MITQSNRSDASSRIAAIRDEVRPAHGIRGRRARLAEPHSNGDTCDDRQLRAGSRRSSASLRPGPVGDRTSRSRAAGAGRRR